METNIIQQKYPASFLGRKSFPHFLLPSRVFHLCVSAVRSVPPINAPGYTLPINTDPANKKILVSGGHGWNSQHIITPIIAKKGVSSLKG